MRVLTLAALSCASILTLWSIYLDSSGVDPDGLAGRLAACRKDQLLSTLARRSSGSDSLGFRGFSRLVAMAPSDAFAWAALADFRNASGSPLEARRALDRAVELAPNSAAIRMRRTNLCYETGDRNCVLEDGKHILGQTQMFDGAVFLYYRSLKVGAGEVIARGLPEDRRACRSWALHLAKNAKSVSDVTRTWSRLHELGFTDGPLAGQMATELVRRGEYDTAWAVWNEARRHARLESDPANLLTNGEFTRKPLISPFDWALNPQPGLTFLQDTGLHVEFAGKTNLAVSNVSQLSSVRPGPHRLVVELAHDEITTDQGPYIRVMDAEQPGRLSVRTEMFRGTSPRRTVELAFDVPPGCRLLRVQLERTPSEKFDNKIAGTLSLYRVSLKEAAPRRR